jgi:glucuronate isomerase
MRRSFQNVPLHEASRRVLCPFRGSLVCAYKRILLKEKGGEG